MCLFFWLMLHVIPVCMFQCKCLKLKISFSTFCLWCAIVLTGDNGHCVDCAPVLTEEECGVVNNCLTTTSTTNNYSDNFVALLYWQQHNFTNKISNFHISSFSVTKVTLQSTITNVCPFVCPFFIKKTSDSIKSATFNILQHPSSSFIILYYPSLSFIIFHHPSSSFVTFKTFCLVVKTKKETNSNCLVLYQSGSIFQIPLKFIRRCIIRPNKAVFIICLVKYVAPDWNKIHW